MMIGLKNSTQEIQNRLLEIFKRFIVCLEENHLQWWVDGGTAIGTVRHKGFIPWDDDIDIVMPWDDYKKLLSMGNYLKKYDLALDVPYGENNCCFYAKIYDTHSTVWQVKRYESIIGLWIDVLPFFRSNKTEEEYISCTKYFTKLTQNYMGGISKFYFDDVCQLIKGLHIKGLYQYILDMTYRKWTLNKTINASKQFLNALNEVDGTYYIFPFSYLGNINRLPIQWFEEIIHMPFEDTIVNIPAEYDKVLKYYFGNYMQLPPEEKRVSHHSMYFMDINNRYTKEQILHNK